MGLRQDFFIQIQRENSLISFQLIFADPLGSILTEKYFLCNYFIFFRFDRTEETSILGVESFEYKVVPSKTFGNSKSEPSNSCYNNFLPHGVHNSTGCKGGDSTLKTFVSLPHFLGADQSFIEQFEEGSKREGIIYFFIVKIFPQEAWYLMTAYILQVLQFRKVPQSQLK